MKHFSKIWAIAVLAVVMCCGFMVGCGKPTVNLNDYVVVKQEGYEGFGVVSFSLNYSKLIEDNKEYLTDENLDSSIFGDKTASLAAELIFSMNKPFALVYESPENAKTGDVVEVKWNTSEDAIEKLSQVLEVEFTYKDFSHTFAALKPVKEIDPFENVKMKYFGMNGEATASEYEDVVIKTENGEISYRVKVENNSYQLSNGDKIKISIDIDEEKQKSLAQNHGLKLSRTSTELIVEGLAYYPGETPKEVIECVSEKEIDTVKSFILEEYSQYAGDLKAEYVGMLYYHNTTEPEVSYASGNRLVFIFHMENGIKEGGWYNYCMSTGNVMIAYTEDENGNLVKCVKSYNGNEFPGVACPSEYDDDFIFEYKNLYYAGAPTLEDLITKINNCSSIVKKNHWTGVIEKRYFEHLYATEELEQYIK